MVLPFLAPIISALAGKGLSLLSDTLSSAADTGVEMVKAKVKEVTGIDITDHDQVSALTPEQVVQLKQFELEHEQFLIEARLREKKMDNEDRADARGMQKAALAQQDTFAKRFVYYYAAAVTLFACAYIAMVTFAPIPVANQRAADTCLGFMLGTAFTGIIQYFFGSSAGSKAKDDLISGHKEG